MLLLSRLRRLTTGAEARFAPVEGDVAGAGFDPDASPPAEAGAEVVEGDGALRVVPVGPPEPSGFASFLDGIQRARVKLYCGPVPIVYAYGAAVVRHREGRRMSTLAAAGGDGGLRTRFQEEREALFYPARYVDPAWLRECGATDEQLVPTDEAADEPIPLFPPLLYQRASQAVNRWREELEASLARRWCASPADHGWLLADGSLTLASELAACPRAVGLVKSHRTRFFDGDDARALLGLRAGERTSVFRPGTRQFTPVFSWYLRLRPADGRDVFWGLIRVEAAARPQTIELADRISRWLLAEASPLALPDARWDRLLYPIRDCEQYLRSRAPGL